MVLLHRPCTTLLFIAVFSSKGVTHPVILHILSHTVTQGRENYFLRCFGLFLLIGYWSRDNVYKAFSASCYTSLTLKRNMIEHILANSHILVRKIFWAPFDIIVGNKDSKSVLIFALSNQNLFLPEDISNSQFLGSYYLLPDECNYSWW